MMWALCLAAGAWAAGDEDFDALLVKFQAAVAAKDREATADLAELPFLTWDLYGRLPKRLQREVDGTGPLALGRASFVEYWPYLFDRQARRAIARARPVAVDDGMGVGIWHGDTWSVWLQFYPNDAGDWRLCGTNNVSE